MPSGSAAGERLAELLAPAVEATGLELESVAVGAAGRRTVLKVVVDLPADQVGSADLDTVAEAARAVGAVLDGSDAAARELGDAPYSLEVTTPGVDRPLRARRHWSRARTRLVAATLRDGTSLTGRVVRVGDDGVVLSVGGERRLVAWAELDRGHVQVEFSRPGPVELADDEVDDEAGELADDEAGDEAGDEADADTGERAGR